MRVRSALVVVLGTISATLCGGDGPGRARAQQPLVTGPALGRPAIIEEGWAEVVSATSKWLVIQNARGQQFPVNYDQVNTFFVRWPTSVDRITPEALVEVTGTDEGVGAVGSDHIDVYEGGARALVGPAVLYTNAAGALISPLDFTYNNDAYGDRFPGIGNAIQGGVLAGPNRVHLVGTLVNRNPLRIIVPGNNTFAVVTGPAGLSATQVTVGSPNLVRPGDNLYFVASNAGPKSLTLAQLIVYKRMSIAQFGP